jgi:hypothetical protein
MKVTVTAPAPAVLYGEIWLAAGCITELRISTGATIYGMRIYGHVNLYYGFQL